jgi:hypothetical protein
MCSLSLSQVNDHRECWTCKQRLHKSSFYKENIVKYFNCIPCERARTAKVRDKARYVEGEDGCCRYACPRCRKPIVMEKLFKGVDTRFDFYNCPCEAFCRLAHHKVADSRTGMMFAPAKAQCPFCGKWGCTAFDPFVCCKGDYLPSDKGFIHKLKEKERSAARREAAATNKEFSDKLAARRIKAKEREKARREAAATNKELSDKLAAHKLKEKERSAARREAAKNGPSDKLAAHKLKARGRAQARREAAKNESSDKIVARRLKAREREKARRAAKKLAVVNNELVNSEQ